MREPYVLLWNDRDEDKQTYTEHKHIRESRKDERTHRQTKEERQRGKEKLRQADEGQDVYSFDLISRDLT